MDYHRLWRDPSPVIAFPPIATHLLPQRQVLTLLVVCEAVRMETPAGVRFTLTVEDDFNRIRWAPEMTIFGRDVRTAIGAVNAISTAGRRPLLVHVGFIERVTPAARELLIEDTCSTRIAVLGHDVVSMVITAFAYASATPTQFFTDEAAAMDWLRESIL